MNTEKDKSIIDVSNDLNSLLRKFFIKEIEWEKQKSNFIHRVAELEGQLRAQENINIDLLKRIKMLELAVSKERNQSGTEVSQKVEEKYNFLSEDELSVMLNKVNKPSLLDMLEDIGIDDEFTTKLFSDLELNKAEMELNIKESVENRIKKLADDRKLQVSPDIPREKFNETTSIPIPREKQSSAKDYKLKESQVLIGHLDAVRKLDFLPNYKCIVSVSEDCLIKLWDYKNSLQSLCTLRGHTGPLFSLAVNPANSMFFTSGIEGIIKVWRLPDNFFQRTETDFSHTANLAVLAQSKGVVWKLLFHKQSVTI